MTWALALVVKPLVLIGLFALIVWPITRLVSRYLPEGRLKRVLFFSWRV